MKDLNNFVSRFSFELLGEVCRVGLFWRGVLSAHSVSSWYFTKLGMCPASITSEDLREKNAHMASGVFGWLQRIEEGKF